MTSPTPLTAVITTYGHQAYVEQCLDSVAAQTRPASQVIIIDDASNDATVSVIERWLYASGSKYEFIRHDVNVGLCTTLNEALGRAIQPYFCQISGDDWEESDRFERQVETLEGADPSVAVIVGDIREVDAGGATLVDHDFGTRTAGVVGTAAQKDLLARLLAENVIPAPGAMVRTNAIRSIGGYDKSLAFEDYDLWLRLSLEHAIEYRSGIVANYRVHRQSMTRSTERRVSLLTSEATALAKCIGQNDAMDSTIHQRLLAIASDTITIGDLAGARRILEQAVESSPSTPTTREAAQLSRRRHGIERLRERRREFGMPEPTR